MQAVFTRQAEEDIKGILAWLLDREGPDFAETVLEQFIAARDSLCRLPDRGRVPPELARVNVLSYREIQIKPYRVVYHIDKATQTVFIHLVTDARRHFAEILKERLLNSVIFEKG